MSKVNYLCTNAHLGSYRKGQRAKRNGQPRSSPYAISNPASLLFHKAWCAGWDAAKRGDYKPPVRISPELELRPSWHPTVVCYNESSRRWERSTGVSLTNREESYLGLLARGLTAKEAGARMRVSHRTGEWISRKLRAKFGARNISELRMLACQIFADRLIVEPRNGVLNPCFNEDLKATVSQ